MRAPVLANLLALATLWFTACVPVLAQAQVYRCTAPGGSVAYQDHPCARGQHQQLLDVPSRPPPGYVPPPPATAPQPVAPSASSPAPVYTPPPPAPLPVMYACVGAVNGKHYLAYHPPPPYFAPLGALGYPPQSLSQAYGAPGGAGVSAPEAAPRPRIIGPSVAAGMTEVEDACMPATHVEVCTFVQHEYDDNRQKLHAALLASDRKPLQQRELQLQDQLRNCR
ncbi:MAG: DUF4124 domain-containing protein [Proteobacteria bacterium]|nr:DUF4124 domain-containing protein [Pseudomonadota bacterium]